MERISVIIPIYNSGPYLDRCLQSVVDQTYRNIEVILVNDGSTDRSPSICDFWADKDSRIKVIHKQNGGVSSARNAGLDIATGDFVFFCDSDDAMVKECLELLFQCQKEHDSEVSVGLLKYIYDPEKYPDDFSVNTLHFQSRSLSIQSFFNLKTEKRIITGKLIKRKCIGELRFDPGLSIGEDTVFFYQLLQRSQLRISLCPVELYLAYRDHISATTGERVLPGFFSVGKWCIENWRYSETEGKEYLLLEGLKNLFLYRNRCRKQNDHLHKKDVVRLLHDAVPELIQSPSVPAKEKIAYSMMAYIPALYTVYSWWVNRE